MRWFAGGLAFLAGLAAATSPDTTALSGDVSPVHDPAIIRSGDHYYLFATGHASDPTGLLPMRSSRDLVTWTFEQPALPSIPDWAREKIQGTRGLWAPDIVRSHGEYRLYYSVSTFGKNRSAIGLATASTIDPDAPGYGWTDRGPVIESHPDDDFNAIDPAVFTDREGHQWMAFGSFWSGIKLIRLDPETGLRSDQDRAIHSIARRPSPGAVEAPFVIERDGFYYLFVSFDFCCRGARSTYHTVVGRSRSPTGPYVDRDGRPMMEGGGTLVLHETLEPGGRFAGPGHVAVLRDGDVDHIVYHAYDRRAEGAPTLRIRRLVWSDDGWPTAQLASVGAREG
ncbi:arabinan endo-1,5-alpha-L-arabinosidase [Sphingosinicella sp. CPCC 101087]|uniref:arabinan endo-1,5-alpha-L-arabinosidase n=1 Tax=Sphingosinicella sp. CPCC 101087 TaxID=2497754 RepID=UPI00101D996A|nr:arabinan endo-1,5-alpha-L-arabinosidase [Sphingosinicella sp. CPCC 101087]